MAGTFRMSDDAFWRSHPMFDAIKDAVAGSDPSIRVTHFPLGDPTQPDTPIVVILQMAPGYVISHHAHASERVEVVVQGSIDTADGVLGPGDVMTAAPDELYGPKVCGPDGCTTAEVFANVRAACETIVETPEGERVRIDYRDPDARAPSRIAGMEGISERQRAVLELARARSSGGG